LQGESNRAIAFLQADMGHRKPVAIVSIERSPSRFSGEAVSGSEFFLFHGDGFMNSESVSSRTSRFAITHVGQEREGAIHVIWGHGWGQSSAALLPLAESLGRFAYSSLIDFPGFGNSPLPPQSWGTADYADAVAEWLKNTSRGSCVWVGHSFGGRVGIQLASRHPGLLSGMVLIAGAGLPRRRSLREQLRVLCRRYAFKAAKLVVAEGPRLEMLRARFGSSDYRAAGALRPIFTRVVNEDLTTVARTVQCPVLLLYGDMDRDTPPEIGERLHRALPNSKLIVLQGFDHHTILLEGRHQVLRQVLGFLEGIQK
jgi:pimeloyl-ACP methyl ester carboxylesterase